MAAALVYTLPTLQLVCHLVATGNSTIVGTTPGTNGAPSSSVLPTLPTSYVAFSDFGVAYKIHRELLPWIQAKTKCAEEGGHLADIDSDLKPGLFSSLPGGGLERDTYTGIHLMNYVWHSDRTGLPVPNLPWADGEPNGVGGCALMRDLAANRLEETPAPSPSPISALSNGYVAIRDFGVAYKSHREQRTWIEAKAICAEKGGHLADIDSVLKIQVLWSFPGGGVQDVTYTGIHLIRDVWHSDRTGLPVPNLPWAEGEPYGGGGCALMNSYAEGNLGQFSCDSPRKFVCQIPYLSL